MISIFKNLYTLRFSKKDREMRVRLWDILCAHFFQNFISAENTVVDMGAGFCEFINSIKAKEKIAIDELAIRDFAGKDVKILNSLDDLEANSIDVIFMSNFLEHLLSIENAISTLNTTKRVLKKSGRLIIIGPNMRFAYKQYWNFIDHQLALSDLSLSEAIKLLDFKIIKQNSKFLPFSTKTKYPKWGWLVKLYLKLPFLWMLFGKQYLIVCEKQ